jgi:periplasmic protein TonB
MNKETILKSDVLDILFDKRNKAYGAYNLRKFYNNRLIKSLAVMLSCVVVLSAFTFLPKKEKPISANDEGGLTVATVKLPEDKPKEDKPKEQPKKEIKQKPVEHAKLLSKIVITKNNVDTVKTITDKVAIGSVNINLPKGGDPINPPVIIPPNTGGGGDGEPKNTPKPFVDITKTYGENEVDVMPSYPGGMDALRKFLEKHLENPSQMEEGEAVNVKVKFVVAIDGKLQSFVTVQDGGDEFNREVMRVLKKMPNWIPGKAKGQNVSVFYTIPVKFIAPN